MWIGGDAIMFGFMMLVVLMWSRDDRTSVLGHGWLERARRSRFDDMVGTAHPAAAEPARGGIDDDDHLAAYNAYLAQLNAAESERRQG
jgi:hypothetical protein